MAGAPPTLALGSAHTCAIDADGEVRCWGGNRDYARDGQHNGSAAVPVTVERTSVAAATTLAASNRLTCARDATGSL